VTHCRLVEDVRISERCTIAVVAFLGLNIWAFGKLKGNVQSEEKATASLF
jgi:hypothetical protein